MAMIYFVQEGDYSKATKYLQKLKKAAEVKDILSKYADEGLVALAEATPIESGLTSQSWEYEIEITKSTWKITYTNSNVNKGVPIAIILQYGHGTRNGGWVEGRDYINPAIQPIFDEIVDKIWKEVTNS